MKYVTWVLTWDGDYGYGPELVAAEHGAKLNAAFASPSVESGTTLGYLTGDLDLSLLVNWQVTEISQAEALAFVQELNPEAFILDDGRITTPYDDYAIV